MHSTDEFKRMVIDKMVKEDRRPSLQLNDETFELLMDCVHCGFCLTV
ncbi:MAG: hypothetical protein N2116_04285 [Armatimonadetes bacterium]|nr:hypothetical protein [Armatimonadota bacterium]